MAICRECSNELVVGENWLASNAKIHSNICFGCQKIYRQENRDKINARNRGYYQENRDDILAQKRGYWQARRGERLIYCRQYDQTHRVERRIARQQRAREQRGEETRAMRIRRQTDTQFRLACNLRTRLYKAIRGGYKAGSAVRDLGCSISEFMAHFETLFTEGMSWDNYGEWHIDHIIPLAAFDLTDREQLLRACHRTNLQPLWAMLNLRKGANTEAQ